MERGYKIVKKDRAGLDPIAVPTYFEIAWTAGIFEGEGSCTASGIDGRSFSICISQKDPELLYRIRDWFGGSVKLYNVGNQRRFQCYHWVVCGDKGRVFIGCIYPYLTERRKEQIRRTRVSEFLDIAQDLITAQSSEPSKLYQALWERIADHDTEQRNKAREHKKKREKEWRNAHADDEQRKSHRRDVRRATRARKKLQKEQLKIEDTS